MLMKGKMFDQFKYENISTLNIYYKYIAKYCLKSFHFICSVKSYSVIKTELRMRIENTKNIGNLHTNN